MKDKRTFVIDLLIVPKGAPETFDELLSRAQKEAVDNNAEVLQVTVRGRARLRLWNRMGFTALKKIKDVYVMERSVKDGKEKST